MGIKKLHIALVGCGYWGKHFLRLCQQHPGVHLVGVYDRSALRRAELAQQHPDVYLFDSWETLLNAPSLDAAIVATGLSAHYAVTEALLKAGKHVLCEKPLTITAAESTQLGAIAKANKATLMVGHTFEFNSAVLYARQEINKGVLGSLYYLSFRRCGNGPIRDDADVVYDLATHDVSIANLLLGSVPHKVSAIGHKLIGTNQFDFANINLLYAGNVAVDICVSWVELVKQREMKAVGSQGMLLFNDVVPSEKIRIYRNVVPQTQTRGDFGDFQLSVSNSEVIIPQINYKEPLQEELQHFMDSIYQEVQPKTDYKNAANVVRVLEAVEKSIALNGQSVNVI